MNAMNRRRDFIKYGGTAALGLVASGLSLPAAAAPTDIIRVGMVGVGARGGGLLADLLKIEGVQVPALCDINETNLARNQQRVVNAGQPKPKGYSRNKLDFRRMCQEEDLDLVINATPWEWHAPVSLAAMKAGKHTATEVPAAVTEDECWKLVETSEKTGKMCSMLENACYMRNVMMVLVMVRKGILGELVHCEAGYQHDARYVAIDRKGELLWRGEEATRNDGNLYPTHPIGPVAQWLDINRGDRFEYLVSMSSASHGLNRYAAKRWGEDHKLAKKNFKQGDVNVTLIRTKKGRSITLYFDTQLPRPYDLIFRIQGTEGIYSGSLDKIYLEDKSPKVHQWEDIDKYAKKYDHPLWNVHAEKTRGSGHGGADYLMLYRLIKNLKEGNPPDIDVYDAADWTVIYELSKRSVAKKSRPIDFPDFTKGKWKKRAPIGIVEG
jgi:predicted dehydrogenase